MKKAIILGLIVTCAIMYAVYTFQDDIKLFAQNDSTIIAENESGSTAPKAPAFSQEAIDCNVSIALTKDMGSFHSGTFHCSPEGLEEPVNVTYTITPGYASYSVLRYEGYGFNGQTLIETITINQGQLNGTVYFVIES